MKNFLILAASFGIFVSCSQKNQHTHSKGFFDAFYGRDAYEKLFDQQTQEDRLSSNFDMTAVASVTYWSSELAEKYASALIEDYLLNEVEAAATKKEQAAEANDFETFIVSLITRNTSWGNLGTRNSLWSAHAQTEKMPERITAYSIQKIDFGNEKSRQYIKTMNRFGETYKVRFKKTDLPPGESTIRFFLSGPLGTMAMSFERPSATR